MKKQPSKRDIRNQLDQEIENFLSSGGQVNSIERGISGRDDPAAAPADNPFAKPREKRTPVLDTVASIEARRKSKQPPAKKPKPTGPVKKPVLDDFGEVIRWVWVDE